MTRWVLVLAFVTVAGAFLLGATAIDKNDEQSCKDRYAADIRALPVSGRDDPEVIERFVGPEPSCDGFLPW